jgi:hypothetical protein
MAYSIFLLFGLFSVPISLLSGSDLYTTVDRLSSIIDNLNDLHKEILITEMELTRFYYLGERSDLWMPRITNFKSLVEEIQTIEPNIGVESIQLLPMPGYMLEIREHDQIMLGLYNILRSISALEGIEYYSASRRKMRTFFKTFYAVSSLENPERKADPLVKVIPETASILVAQQDLTFGKNFSRLTYGYDGNNITLSLENLKTMWYGIIPLISPLHMQIHLIVVPLEDYILFYGNSAVKTTISIFGIEKSKTDSFYNRIKALYNWFSLQVSSKDTFLTKF